jgi:mono/diheme cytochrome c family protein
MKKWIIATTSIILLLILGAAAFIYGGVYNVAATDPHWRIVYQLIDTIRVRSIKAHAAGIQTPAGLDADDKIVMGTDHYAAHCAVCHGAPGVPKGEIAQGLYPQPADLAESAKTYQPNELFWILKNGIKMTGMPAWSDHGDDELWATVAFLQKLPGMTEEEYAKLVMASMAKGGHHHSGEDQEGGHGDHTEPPSR